MKNHRHVVGKYYWQIKEKVDNILIFYLFFFFFWGGGGVDYLNNSLNGFVHRKCPRLLHYPLLSCCLSFFISETDQ